MAEDGILEPGGTSVHELTHTPGGEAAAAEGEGPAAEVAPAADPGEESAEDRELVERLELAAAVVEAVAESVSEPAAHEFALPGGHHAAVMHAASRAPATTAHTAGGSPRDGTQGARAVRKIFSGRRALRFAGVHASHTTLFVAGGAAAVATGIAVAVATTSGGGGAAPAGQPALARQLRSYLTRSPSVRLFAFWEGYPIRATSCPSSVALGPRSNYENYAGNIWMQDGVLYADGVELSGSYQGTLAADGSIRMQTAPDPTASESVDARITGLKDGAYQLAGTFSDVAYGTCVVEYTITSGRIDSKP